jgi:hypothetical protein
VFSQRKKLTFFSHMQKSRLKKDMEVEGVLFGKRKGTSRRGRGTLGGNEE